MSRELGVLRDFGRALEVDAIAVGIGERHDPERVAHEGLPCGREATCEDLVVDGERVGTHEADRHAEAERARWSQVVAVIGSSIWAFAFTIGMLWLIDRVTPVKVSEAHEEAGLDEALHGEVAYLGAD